MNILIDAWLVLTISFIGLFMVWVIGGTMEFLSKWVKIKLYTYYLRRFHHVTKDCAKEIAHNMYDD